ncbi:DUF4157 domain-containing protein [Variovorax sp. LjRoot84]|uniref:eCIS core domain-containing protein n=1 Tax=Variovorax sp. LjRoot84 TaxID=3342340 RepID=UPI003ECDEE4B
MSGKALESYRSEWSAASSSDASIQRQCAACKEEEDRKEEEEKVRLAPKGPAAEAPAETSVAEAETAPAVARRDAASDLLAEDDADAAGDRMRKSEFMAALRAQVCATVDAGLRGTGRDSQGCPWIDHWLGHYEGRSAAQLERAILKYAPEAASAASARDYIRFVTARVSRSVDTWARTGEIEGMPEDLPGNAMPGGGMLDAFGGMFFKARPGGAREADPVSVRDQLGSGRSLPGAVRTRMESAFGADFAGVRLHTDAKAAQLSEQLNARAFTLGEHVAFGAGEYRPGTLVGDALMAHELAHVLQQGGRTAGPPQAKSGPGEGALEEEADTAAVGAVTALWSGRQGQGRAAAKPSQPGLRSSLRLQRCSGNTKKPAAAPNLQTDKVLRQSWEAAFQEGLDLLNDSVGKKGKEKGCAFPGDKPAEAWRYDKEYWRQITHGDEVRKYRVAFEPTKEPHVSVDQLFAHLDRWECDCALFTELTWLYAWRHTLSNTDFDSKFSNLRLRPQETTGLERQTHVRENIEMGLEGGKFDDLWANAPVGTKVNWTNESVHARSPWRYENAVKRTKGKQADQDRYDAHPMGAKLSEAQIKRGLAENSEDFPGRPFVITDQTLVEMKAAGAPADFIGNLEPLKGREFIGKKEFSKALAEPAKPLLPLRANDPDRYASLMEKLFATAHAPATEEEKQAYVDKYIRRYEIQIPK